VDNPTAISTKNFRTKASATIVGGKREGQRLATGKTSSTGAAIPYARIEFIRRREKKGKKEGEGKCLPLCGVLTLRCRSSSSKDQMHRIVPGRTVLLLVGKKVTDMGAHRA